MCLQHGCPGDMFLLHFLFLYLSGLHSPPCCSVSITLFQQLNIFLWTAITHHLISSLWVLLWKQQAKSWKGLNILVVRNASKQTNKKKASPEAFVTQFYNKKDNCSNNHRKKLLQSNGKNSDADGRDTKKERLCEHKRKEAAQPVLAVIKGNELLHSQVHSAHIYHSSVSAVWLVTEWFRLISLKITNPGVLVWRLCTNIRHISDLLFSGGSMKTH